MPSQVIFEFLLNLLQRWWQSSLERECWVWLTYSAIYSRIQHLSFIGLWSQISTSLLVARSSYCNSSVWSIQEDHPSLPNRGSIISSQKLDVLRRLSYGSTATVISTELGKKNLNLIPIHFYWNWFLKSILMTASSWHQISKSSWLYIFISIWIFQLLWNMCDCFFHRAAWVIIRALLVRRVYNRVYGQFPHHFYFGHKSFKSFKSFKSCKSF